MKITKYAGALLLALGLSTAAVAGPISGEIFFTGTATLNGTPATATAITFNNEFVVAGNGDYSAIPALTTASFTDFAFGAVGNTGPLSVNPLWTVSFGGLTYSFELLTLTLNSIDGSQRLLEGWGTATITGGGSDFDATAGFWSLSTSGTGSTISFSSYTSVPDGGTTAALLGLALVGVSFFARRRLA